MDGVVDGCSVGLEDHPLYVVIGSVVDVVGTLETLENNNNSLVNTRVHNTDHTLCSSEEMILRNDQKHSIVLGERELEHFRNKNPRRNS